MEREQAIKLMQDLLRRLVDRKGSDLFITSGFPPAIKVDGEIRPQSERVLTPEQAAVLVRSIMNDKQTKEFDSTKECNFAIAPELDRIVGAHRVPCLGRIADLPRSPDAASRHRPVVTRRTRRRN